MSTVKKYLIQIMKVKIKKITFLQSGEFDCIKNCFRKRFAYSERFLSTNKDSNYRKLSHKIINTQNIKVNDLFSRKNFTS